MNPHIYLIPGMGCDERLFSELAIYLDFTVIRFLPPLPGETLPQYAARMAGAIDQEKPFIIGGVSFGGMISAEIAKITKPAGVLFISTAKSSQELPFWLKFFRFIPVHRLMGGKTLKAFWPKSPFPRAENFKTIMLSMKNDADPFLFKWSVNAAANYNNRELPPHFIHLHGTRDLLLPGVFVRKPVTKIKGGDHGLVMAHASEVAEYIRHWITTHNPA
jgi:pimeloyl-ACP methyl ester carboxylesterase